MRRKPKHRNQRSITNKLPDPPRIWTLAHPEGGFLPSPRLFKGCVALLAYTTRKKLLRSLGPTRKTLGRQIRGLDPLKFVCQACRKAAPQIDLVFLDNNKCVLPLTRKGYETVYAFEGEWIDNLPMGATIVALRQAYPYYRSAVTPFVVWVAARSNPEDTCEKQIFLLPKDPERDNCARLLLFLDPTGEYAQLFRAVVHTDPELTDADLFPFAPIELLSWVDLWSTEDFPIIVTAGDMSVRIEEREEVPASMIAILSSIEEIVQISLNMREFEPCAETAKRLQKHEKDLGTYISTRRIRRALRKEFEHHRERFPSRDCMAPFRVDVEWDRLFLFHHVIWVLETWRFSRGVYRLDNDLLEAVLETDLESCIPPWETLERLPEWCVYVELPNTWHADERIFGFFACFERAPEEAFDVIQEAFGWDLDSKVCGMLHLVYDLDRSFASLPGLQYQSLLVHQGESLKALLTKLSDPGEADDLSEREMTVARGNFASALSILFYLCSETAKDDIECETGELPSREYATRVRAEEPKGEYRTWEVGWRMGGALREAREEYEAQGTRTGGWKVRPHVRRAHYHRFWCGPRNDKSARYMRSHWLPPIPVNIRDADEDVVVTFRRVEDDETEESARPPNPAP